MIVAPCTGNTLGKLANGITDTSVTMAVKSCLRIGLPVVLAPATNDALAGFRTESRQADEYEKYLFRADEAGRTGKKAVFPCRRFQPDSAVGPCRAGRKTASDRFFSLTE